MLKKSSLILFTLLAFTLSLHLIACEEDCEDCDCDCDDDDDSADDDDDDNNYNSCDPNQECVNWYVSCWGEAFSSYAADFCGVYQTQFNQYWDTSNACVINAECEFFGCLQANLTDCIGTDQTQVQTEIDACWMVFEATANAC
ncbi:MAG TPA: hypothetical protein PKW95_02325 [bacterium]|nr:hypothetical protein [bacterium]